jgi:hypothetical protein
MTIDKLNRVAALGDEAKQVVDWALRLEGALHKIEELEREYGSLHDGVASPGEIATQALSVN